MPRTVQEILDQADELADLCEAYEPDPANERPVSEYLLERAARALVNCDRQVAHAVSAARSDGMGWARIGDTLGMSARAAEQRYGTTSRPAATTGE